MTASTAEREHLNKWLWKRTILHSQNVIGCITWMICSWPWKFNLHSEPLNELCSLRSLQNKVYRPDSLLAQANRVTLASMVLSSFVPAVSLACRPCSADPESFQVNGKGPWLQGTLDHAWCTMCFANWISYTAEHHVHTHSVSWHVLTQE